MKRRTKNTLPLPTDTAGAFLREYRLMADKGAPAKLRRWLAAQWKEVIGPEVEVEVPQTLQRLAIAYALQQNDRMEDPESYTEAMEANGTSVWKVIDSLVAGDYNPSLLSERLQKAGIEGDIRRDIEMAANRKAAAKKRAATTKPQTAKQKAVFGGSKGKTLGLAVGATRIRVFNNNETCAKAKRMTDDQIRSFMMKEFPDRKPSAFENVQAARRHYNAGGYSKGEVPTKLSRQYDSNGDVVEARRGRPTGSTKKTKAKAKATGKKKATKKKATKKVARKK